MRKKRAVADEITPDEIEDAAEQVQDAVEEVTVDTLPEAVKEEVTKEVTNDSGYVQVSMYETLAAPIIGNFDVRKELGVQNLEGRTSYSLPTNVALVLVDSKKACLV